MSDLGGAIVRMGIVAVIILTALEQKESADG